MRMCHLRLVQHYCGAHAVPLTCIAGDGLRSHDTYNVTLCVRGDFGFLDRSNLRGGLLVVHTHADEQEQGQMS